MSPRRFVGRLALLALVPTKFTIPFHSHFTPSHTTEKPENTNIHPNLNPTSLHSLYPTIFPSTTRTSSSPGKRTHLHYNRSLNMTSGACVPRTSSGLAHHRSCIPVTGMCTGSHFDPSYPLPGSSMSHTQHTNNHFFSPLSWRQPVTLLTYPPLPNRFPLTCSFPFRVRDGAPFPSCI